MNHDIEFNLNWLIFHARVYFRILHGCTELFLSTPYFVFTKLLQTTLARKYFAFHAIVFRSLSSLFPFVYYDRYSFISVCNQISKERNSDFLNFLSSPWAAVPAKLLWSLKFHASILLLSQRTRIRNVSKRSLTQNRNTDLLIKLASYLVWKLKEFFNVRKNLIRPEMTERT